MSERLRGLAARALASRRRLNAGEARIDRVVIEVTLGDRTELVTLTVRDDRLTIAASDGAPDSSLAAEVALAWVAATARVSVPPLPTPEPPRTAAETAGAGVAAILQDLLVAAVRSGIAAMDSPAVLDALARLERASTLIELQRWLARFRAAASAGDELEMARLLDGAGVVGGADDLLELPPERLVDRVLVEIARERVDGVGANAIERRYLLDLADGEVLAEERVGDASASNGPCPRVVTAGLAERTATGRVRILQYTVAPLDPDAHARLLERATSVEVALRGFLQALRRPGAAAFVEPVALLSVSRGASGHLLDREGEPVPLAWEEEPGACVVLTQGSAAEEVSWLMGRWSARRGQVSLVPLSCGVGGHVVRLR